MVVLPAPLGPSSEKMMPSGTCRSMPLSTTWLPYDLRRPVMAIAGMFVMRTTVPSGRITAVSPWFQRPRPTGVRSTVTATAAPPPSVVRVQAAGHPIRSMPIAPDCAGRPLSCG
ncbi:hypothetical protein GCM10010532_110220 [Dactylosporangium siamense]